MCTCILNGKLITDREMLHEILAELPVLPSWYGRNLDALHDCLTDVQEEVWIRIQNEKDLTLHLGNYAAAFLNVLAASSEENNKIHYVVEPD